MKQNIPTSSFKAEALRIKRYLDLNSCLNEVSKYRIIGRYNYFLKNKDLTAKSNYDFDTLKFKILFVINHIPLSIALCSVIFGVRKETAKFVLFSLGKAGFIKSVGGKWVFPQQINTATTFPQKDCQAKLEKTRCKSANLHFKKQKNGRLKQDRLTMIKEAWEQKLAKTRSVA